MYADLTTKNRSYLKRFSHGSRFRIAVELINPKSNDSILDYGTGDGFMLSQIRSANKDCKIVGYEPVLGMYKELQERLGKDIETENLEIENDISSYNKCFDKICCLEVFEHLPEEVQKAEIEQMTKLLTDDGELIVSVPIEVGFSSLLKNMARLFLRQTHGNTSIRTMFLSLLGIKFDRGDKSYIPSHMGFYYNDLEKMLLSSGLKLKKKMFSPIPILGAFVNSQVFFVLEKK